MSCGSHIHPTAFPINFAPRGVPKIPSASAHLLTNLRRLARLYARRRQRLALLELDERLLRDIGISRQQARAESQKPFWT